MKHGRAIIPEPVTMPVLDPEGDGKVNQWSRRISRSEFVPTELMGHVRNGVVATERACLDREGREWLAWALLEFRANPTWRRTATSHRRMTALADRTLRPTTEKEILDAEIDDGPTQG